MFDYDDDFSTVIMAVLSIFGIIFILFCIVVLFGDGDSQSITAKESACIETAKIMERPFEYDKHAGCFIKSEAGNYIPIDNYRELSQAEN